MRRSLLAVSAVSVFVLVGCTPSPELPSEEEVLTAYLNQVLGEPDISDETGFEYVLPGSEAATLATELASRLEAAEQDSVISIENLVSSVEYSEPASEDDDPVLEEVSLCFDSSDHPDAAKENFCFLFDNFEFTEGQLTQLEVVGEPIHGQIIINYFSRHALAHPEGRLAATDFAGPGSNAEAYAIQQSQGAQARLDGGSFDSTGNELVWNEDGVYHCRPSYKNPDVLFEDACSPFSDFSFEGNRLVDFNAGPLPLEGRILVQEGEVLDIGDIGTFELLSAYVSIGGNLVITGEVVSTTEELTIDDWQSVYLIGDGRQIGNSGSWGPSKLKDGRRGYLSLIFSGATIGGDVEVNFYDEDYNDVLLTIPIG